MRIAIICFSLNGAVTAEKLKAAFENSAGEPMLQMQGALSSECRGNLSVRLRNEKTEVRLAKKSKYIPDAAPVCTDTWVREQFAWADAILFVGACGIAVRHIAPYISSKKKDPAVLVIDECGKFVISLLSGHLGGANELAAQTAELLGAIPVVTTATDLHHCFAVDVFARRNNCEILNMQAAKEVSAALLAGKKAGFYSEFPWEGTLPDGLIPLDEKEACFQENSASADSGSLPQGLPEVGIAVTVHRDCRPFSSTAVVVPKNIVLGMGCRKEKDTEAILQMAQEAVRQSGIYQQAVAKLTSIDLKKEEKGLLHLARQWKIPFETYTAQELVRTAGEFTTSDFVKSIAGVDNVCERSAVLGSNQGDLIQKKIGRNGVTAALAAGKWRIYFE